jgi:hypothetical protein
MLWPVVPAMAVMLEQVHQGIGEEQQLYQRRGPLTRWGFPERLGRDWLFWI